MQRITNEEVYEEKIERSRFIVSLKYVEDINQAKEFISQVSKDNKTANHNCWAYVIGKNGDWAHSSDNGEPSGTAGKPILNAINKNDLTNIVIVVTRYFGGVKLGIRGLIDAYGGVSEKAIEINKTQELVDYHHFKIITSYDYNNILQYKLKQFDIEITATDFAVDVTSHIKVSQHLLEGISFLLKDLENNNKIKYIKEEK